ncbi:MAG: MerR family transcriptional regulator [Anaerolineaceae bacterium]|jgi:DNA-binding transcriptional MerR regulator
MVYTVKQLSDLAGVSIRTLHYYDAIDLLKPEAVGENGYRYYGDAAAVRLQQILFFKELGLGLVDIKAILDRPDFDVLQALETHKLSLQEKSQRLERLIQTVDKTLLHLKGKHKMKQKEFFAGFSEEKQKRYEQEIRQRYGEKAFEGVIDWNSYTPEQKAQIKAESEVIYHDLVAVMDQGYDGPVVQAIIARWHQHLRYFYEPSDERLSGLGRLYTEHPDFVAAFRAMHPDLPEFFNQAIQYYVKHKPAKA